MRKSVFLIGVLLASAVLAQPAPPPVITSVEPATAPSTGGTTIIITGRHFDVPPGFACVLPCQLVVHFGSVGVPATAWTDQRVEVLAPPHVARRVDLKVTTGDGRTTAISQDFTFARSAQESWEQVLIPIHVENDLTGGNGSRWKSELLIHNGGVEAVAVAPWPCVEICIPVYPPTRSIPPGQTLTDVPNRASAGSTPGRLLYVEKTRSAAVSFQSRIHDTSRSTLNAGTEIPVVRENELLTAPSNLLGVSFDANSFRYLLRIYEAANAVTRFRVRAFVIGESAPAAAVYESIVEARHASSDPEFRPIPGYAAIDLGVALRPLNGRRLRIEVEPLVANSRYWTFLSITNNETQHVTVVTPQ